MKALAVDLAVMVLSFAGLTLFIALLPLVSRDVPISSSWAWVASMMYAAGVFASYLIGCLPSLASSPRRVVAFSTLAVSASLGLTSLATNPIEIAVLRFVQGFASMSVPVFSAQLARLFGRAAPIALGILFSGTFIGGALGYAAPAIASLVGWRGVYAVFALLVALAGAAWLKTCPPLSAVARVSSREAREVARDPFTILWGASFFTAMWVLFTSATLGQMASHVSPSLFGKTLQVSMAAWSVAGGVIAYAMSRGRDVVQGIGRVQQVCLALAALGALAALSARSDLDVVAAAIMIGAVQGASPAFWTLPSVAYPEREAELAGFVLGTLSNAAALVGPAITTALALSVGPQSVWIAMASVSLGGVATTAMAMRVAPPVVAQSHRPRLFRRLSA